mgnify:CR=1 FL=1
MPRKPDPTLEPRILDAAIRLLDQRGLDAVTMRDVARLARTTTPSIYERFVDRDALLHAVMMRVRNEVLPLMESSKDLGAIGDIFIDYFRKHPRRIDIVLRVWPKLFAAGQPLPGFEITNRRLREEFGHTNKIAHDIVIASFSLLMGSAVMIAGSGIDTPAAKAFESATRKALQKIFAGI